VNCICFSNGKIHVFLKYWNCSHSLAIEFQQQVIDAWESHGASAEEELREAQRLLEQLKKKARGVSANEVPMKALPFPNNNTHAASNNSQPDIPLHQSHNSTPAASSNSQPDTPPRQSRTV
jgi:hypothetical protein